MRLAKTHPSSLLCALLAGALIWCGTALAQTDTTTTQTTPTETTPTPAPEPEPAPEPAPEPEPEQTAAPNEYSESVPTGSGTAPTSPQTPSHTGNGSSQPSTIVSADDLSAEDDGAATGAGKDKKKHPAKKTDKKKPHERVTSETPAPAGPSIPATPASSDVGDSARLLWLGLALLMITGGIVSTALARRRRADL